MLFVVSANVSIRWHRLSNRQHTTNPSDFEVISFGWGTGSAVPSMSQSICQSHIHRFCSCHPRTHRHQWQSVLCQRTYCISCLVACCIVFPIVSRKKRTSSAPDEIELVKSQALVWHVQNMNGRSNVWCLHRRWRRAMETGREQFVNPMSKVWQTSGWHVRYTVTVGGTRLFRSGIFCCETLENTWSECDSQKNQSIFMCVRSKIRFETQVDSLDCLQSTLQRRITSSLWGDRITLTASSCSRAGFYILVGFDAAHQRLTPLHK